MLTSDNVRSQQSLTSAGLWAVDNEVLNFLLSHIVIAGEPDSLTSIIPDGNYLGTAGPENRKNALVANGELGGLPSHLE